MFTSLLPLVSFPFITFHPTNLLLNISFVFFTFIFRFTFTLSLQSSSITLCKFSGESFNITASSANKKLWRYSKCILIQKLSYLNFLNTFSGQAMHDFRDCVIFSNTFPNWNSSALIVKLSGCHAVSLHISFCIFMYSSSMPYFLSARTINLPLTADLGGKEPGTQ